jgi:nitrile hydratase
MTHDHDDHEHEHPHAPPRPDKGDEPSYHRYLETAVRELLIDKGVLTAQEVRTTVEAMDARTPANGSRVVAHAWTDPEFKQRLLADPYEACAELDLDIGGIRVAVVEDTADVHNVIVCTLCSCYPRGLLGLPPDWYKARSYRSRVVREPRAVLAEFGTDLPDDVEVRVHDSTADLRYMVLPLRPAGTEHLTEDELEELVTRDCLIGVTLPKLFPPE